MIHTLIPIKEILSKEETFLALLRDKAKKEQYARVEEEVKRGPHPTGKMLYNYVLGWTNRKQANAVMSHIACCDICLNKVMHIRAMENELYEELIQCLIAKKEIEVSSG